jgi:DNA-binding GntR family transcriptional regulator
VNKAVKTLNSAEIYRILRSRLTTAVYEPGQKMKSDGMRGEFGCSISTMREALFRLACEGFLEFEEQKGFRVPTTTDVAFREVAELRVLIEQAGTRLSIAHGDVEWEARLIASHHKLAHIEDKMRGVSDVEPFIQVWSDAEWEFHDTLMSACGSQEMRRLHKNIYDRYRQHLTNWHVSKGFRRNTLNEHKAILDAAIAHDANLCDERIADHLYGIFDTTPNEQT